MASALGAGRQGATPSVAPRHVGAGQRLSLRPGAALSPLRSWCGSLEAARRGCRPHRARRAGLPAADRRGCPGAAGAGGTGGSAELRSRRRRHRCGSAWLAAGRRARADELRDPPLRCGAGVRGLGQRPPLSWGAVRRAAPRCSPTGGLGGGGRRARRRPGAGEGGGSIESRWRSSKKKEQGTHRYIPAPATSLWA
jgi:hypothetical protein